MDAFGFRYENYQSRHYLLLIVLIKITSYCLLKCAPLKE